MIVIIEGIDRVGKTTLCDKLQSEFAGTFVRFRDNTRYAKSHNDMIVNNEKNNTIVSLIEEGLLDGIILDRFHFTEYIYGMCDRGYNNVDTWDIDRRLSAFDKVVLLYIAPTDVKMSSEQHGENLEQHLKMFEECFSMTGIKHKIKVNFMTLDKAVEFVKKLMEVI